MRQERPLALYHHAAAQIEEASCKKGGHLDKGCIPSTTCKGRSRFRTMMPKDVAV